jgi:hypothetical protein
MKQYMVVFYYSLVMLMGNENFPRTFAEEVFVSLAIITGAFLMAFIFGNITALMASLKAKDS